MVWRHGEGAPQARGTISAPDLSDIAELGAVESAVGFGPMTATVTVDGEPALVEAALATNSVLEVFRVRPFLGRDVSAEDNEMGRPPVVVVGHHYWRDRLGGSTDVLGTTIELFGTPHEIIGVAPAGFDFPNGAQLWAPRRVPPECGRGCYSLRVIARLADGATLEAFASELRVLGRRLEATVSGFELWGPSCGAYQGTKSCVRRSRPHLILEEVMRYPQVLSAGRLVLGAAEWQIERVVPPTD